MEYTDDNICRVLGLRGFSDLFESPNGGVSLRLLLKPAFHPEALVSFAQKDISSELEVRVFTDQLWNAIYTTGTQPVVIESTKVPIHIIERLAASFLIVGSQLNEANDFRQVIIADGLSVSGIANHGSRQVRFSGPYTSDLLEAQLCEVLEYCRDQLRSGVCQHVIGAQLPYVSKKYRGKPWVAPPSSNLLLLGPEDDRHEVREALARVRRRSPESRDEE